MNIASLARTRTRRRGVVLVLILGMLGLLALIGVTFATFSGQAQVNARNFMQSQSFPDASEMMDFALSQLIGDTANPGSVIRGHSFLRDMYGNDAYANGPLLSLNPDSADGSGVFGVSTQTYISQNSDLPAYLQGSPLLVGSIKCVTNIPVASPSFYGMNFTRWAARFNGGQSGTVFLVPRTLEVLWDDQLDGSNMHVFYVAAGNGGLPIPATLPPAGPANRPGPDPSITWPAGTPFIPSDPSYAGVTASTLVGSSFLSGVFTSANTLVGVPFSLDGRYLHAFNGAGMASLGTDAIGTLSGTNPYLNRSLAEYANFRYNGNILNNALTRTPGAYTPNYLPGYGDPSFAGDPNYFPMPGMDEDYDACDLENWFLAIQSADGQVVVPSFHRPGILTANDWTYRIASATTPLAQALATRAMARILRPRQADGHSAISFPDLTPGSDGKIVYDVDNDGDGVTDAVWLDLGYPARRNSEGKLYKPLFAFTVIGLNGKLPLNTAGNLQKGQFQNPDHAEHLGFSPSEIDMRFALQNGMDPSNNLPFTDAFGVVHYPNEQFDNANIQIGTGIQYGTQLGVNVALTQLRNLLAGNRQAGSGNNDINTVYVNGKQESLPNGVYDFADNATNPGNGLEVICGTPTVAGRWGEDEWEPGFLTVPPFDPTGVNNATVPYTYTYSNLIRAGRSVTSNASVMAMDSRDDNYNGFDMFPMPYNHPPYIPSTSPPSAWPAPPVNTPEVADYYDPSGSLALPVERLRRFVMPFDLFGSGRIVTPQTAPGPPKITGADALGRVWFQGYYRPPGLAIKTGYTVGNETQPASLGIDPLTSVAYAPTWPDYTNNRYHGFTSQMSPTITGGTDPLGIGGTPSDVFNVTPPPNGTPTPQTHLDNTVTPNVYVQYVKPITQNVVYPPTFDLNVLSTAGRRQLASGNKAVGEADEMNLYSPSRFDAPFGPSDLEWLYRAQDVDGAGLQSRLKDLVPISFVKSIDANRRRRLFALDTWDTTTFAWANDNPQGKFPSNSYCNPIANGGYTSLGGVTPSIAHRDRRVNLNFPLPVSNSAKEPVRQKWIRETYQLLKAVLPPRAVDTPEELAQLSQYVVNMVDFRDPDCTMTRFVNTDVWVIEPADGTTQATLALPGNVTVAPLPPAMAVAYDSTYVLPTPIPGQANSHYLVQYGMEYQPVAINEVLALRFQTNNNRSGSAPGGPPASTLADTDYVSGFWVELVNTLTKDALAGNPDSSDQDLAGWDMVIMQDDGLGRPDMFTGQIPLQDATKVVAYSLKDGSVVATGSGSLGVNGANGVPAQQATSTAATYQVYLMGGMVGTMPGGAPGDTNTAAGYGTVMNTPPGQPLAVGAASRWGAMSDLMQQVGKLKENSYYWVYLRRPPNPFDPSYDTTIPNNNRVVVDSFRFVYTTSTGTAFSQPDGNGGYTAVQGTDPVVNKDQTFSLRRMQPFRGGHAVPPLSGVAGKFVTTAYGFSEQTSVPPTPATVTQGTYQEKKNDGTVTFKYTTSPILHSLGVGNGATADSAWDYFPFNDRDYVSPVEILNVPGCSPGLFTKQFCEVAPPIAGTQPTSAAAGSLAANTWGAAQVWNKAGWAPTQFTATSSPHTMPYLNDEFFYTGMSEPLPPPLPRTAPQTQGWPDPTLTSPPANNNPNAPIYSLNALAQPAYVGGPGGAGWHKMLEFFEVPSSMIGAIGPVAQGANYDWLRQDLKPGQLNLNLIIDEEVFLGLMGESVYGSPWDMTINQRSGVLNQWQCLMDLNAAASPPSMIFANQPPAVVTQVDLLGAPILKTDGSGTIASGYPMPNIGAADLPPLWAVVGSTFMNYMKACFADFLKLRHGGSGYIFGWGNGPTGGFGQPDTTLGRVPLASDRPYRSLSFPDINYTIMRPANLTPSAYTTPIMTDLSAGYPAWPGPLPVAGVTPGLTQDPGLKSPYQFTNNNPVQPQPNPPRRLFQIPDAPGRHGNASSGPCFLYPNAVGFPNWFINTIGAQADVATNYPPLTTTHTATALINSLVVDNTDVANSNAPNAPLYPFNPYRITNPNMDLVAPTTLASSDNNYLGGANGGVDQRDHPYFRTEWMQKMVNLTTVRTHQYAVWITVGFFEVTQQGDPQLANVAFNSGNRLDSQGRDKAYDILGLELDVLSGRNVRHRSFFLIDRTKGVGFNPALPGDFREMVVYRQLIE